MVVVISQEDIWVLLDHCVHHVEEEAEVLCLVARPVVAVLRPGER